MDRNPKVSTLASHDIPLNDSTIIILSGKVVPEELNGKGSMEVHFKCLDDGDVYCLHEIIDCGIPGSITLFNTEESFPATPEGFGKNDDLIKVALFPGEEGNTFGNHYKGYIFSGNKWHQVPVEILPTSPEEIFERVNGLYETSVLSGLIIAIFGLGTVGSGVGVHLAQNGVGNYYLIDDDRLQVGNVSRHAAGLQHFGRYKTNVMTDIIQEKYPAANIECNNEKIGWHNIELVRSIIRKAHIAICVTGDRESNLIVNRVCNEENTPCIFAGAFRRAHGGQVLFVKPGETLCYQCFCMTLPNQASDNEISSLSKAERIAYSDRPVPVEPGLSIDIAPINAMVTKLVIQHFLKDTETTLRSLDEDLVAPWYIWVNRREDGTPYKNLEPLEYNVDGMHVLRWYGVDMRRDPNCPVCCESAL